MLCSISSYDEINRLRQKLSTGDVIYKDWLEHEKNVYNSDGRQFHKKSTINSHLKPFAWNKDHESIWNPGSGLRQAQKLGISVVTCGDVILLNNEIPSSPSKECVYTYTLYTEYSQKL